MNFSGFIGTIVKLAILAAAGYGLFLWQADSRVDDDVEAFAKKACVDEIEQRFDVTRVSTYAVNANSNGYTVRATATLAKGDNAKINCLTNSHGGITDVSIDVR